MVRAFTTVAAALLLGASPAFATPVTWTLNNVSFNNGSTATGSFDFDRDTNTFSNIAISISAGTDYGPELYNAIAPSSGNYFGAIFTTLPLSFNDTPDCNNFNMASCGTHALGLSVWSGQMTNAGGVLALTQQTLQHCDSAACNSGSWSFISDASGTGGTISALIPLPAAAWLFGPAMGLLGLARRRKHQ
ncbi:MAG: hypothetical protein DYH20_15815 [Gammaproteobacteria bacterium PRO9]|nr:hypothetical protein [Gammaproteobacteria bacterium PRO9]